ncbi:MAG: metalloregulator ArsR/SmtB family transcription factor [Actinobacteria bacterium]|nr:metalloregulator ArsR/SmtB family transcription factor [Actinomycetota bacterium]
MAQKYSRDSASAAGKRDTCELYCFNKALVSRLRGSLPDAETLIRAENFFAALGTRTRLLVLYCLSQAEELCVCDIANALRMNISTVSHQLRYLRGAGLIAYRSEGKMAFYRLIDGRIAELIDAELCAKLNSKKG